MNQKSKFCNAFNWKYKISGMCFGCDKRKINSVVKILIFNKRVTAV
jgi:hypothetical protein